MAAEIPGLKRKYNITKADGSEVKGRYFVLKLDSKDEAHRKACQAAALMYAEMIQDHIPDLAHDLRTAIQQHQRDRSWILWDIYLERCDFQPCSPGCPGVAVFDANFEPPEGWVHIERCDDCNRFPHDQAAAESITGCVRFFCVDCDEEEDDRGENPNILTDEEARQHEHDRFRVIIPEEFAKAAVSLGLLNQWWPDE